MENKLSIPKTLISSTVESLIDADDSVKIKVKFFFIPEVESWFNEYIGEIPTIMISRYDFEESGYWVDMSSSEISTAFKIAWL